MKVKKNVWLICKYASPEKYYFGTRHFYFAEEWVKNGNTVTIFTSNSSHLTDKLPNFSEIFFSELINGVNTIWFKLPKSKTSSSIKRIFSWILFELKVLSYPKNDLPKPDVIIASSLSLFSIISGYLLARKFKSKFILEIRDIWPLSAVHLGGYSFYNPFIWLLSKIEKFGYKNADVIVGTMPNLIEHVKKVEPKFKSCICIPQGITSKSFLQQEELPMEYINNTFSSDTFKVVYAGTINQNNPIKVLLDAVIKIPENYKIEAYILGSGSMLEFYKKEYQKFKNIKFIDAIPKKFVTSFIKQTDLCFDSIDSEIAKFGLSRNKWIDYMNAGRPIICSYSGYQSMINEANCGSFTPFGDIDKLALEIIRYRNMSLTDRIAMGIRAREYLINNRLFEKLANDYEKLF